MRARWGRQKCVPLVCVFRSFVGYVNTFEYAGPIYFYSVSVTVNDYQAVYNLLAVNMIHSHEGLRTLSRRKKLLRDGAWRRTAYRDLVPKKTTPVESTAYTTEMAFQ